MVTGPCIDFEFDGCRICRLVSKVRVWRMQFLGITKVCYAANLKSWSICNLNHDEQRFPGSNSTNGIFASVSI